MTSKNNGTHYIWKKLRFAIKIFAVQKKKKKQWTNRTQKIKTVSLLSTSQYPQSSTKIINGSLKLAHIQILRRLWKLTWLLLIRLFLIFFQIQRSYIRWGQQFSYKYINAETFKGKSTYQFKVPLTTHPRLKITFSISLN